MFFASLVAETSLCSKVSIKLVDNVFFFRDRLIPSSRTAIFQLVLQRVEGRDSRAWRSEKADEKQGWPKMQEGGAGMPPKVP